MDQCYFTIKIAALSILIIANILFSILGCIMILWINYKRNSWKTKKRESLLSQLEGSSVTSKKSSPAQSLDDKYREKNTNNNNTNNNSNGNEYNMPSTSFVTDNVTYGAKREVLKQQSGSVDVEPVYSSASLNEDDKYLTKQLSDEHTYEVANIIGSDTHKQPTLQQTAEQISEDPTYDEINSELVASTHENTMKSDTTTTNANDNIYDTLLDKEKIVASKVDTH